MARRRTSYPGVRVVKRVVRGKVYLTARWTDPDSLSERSESLAKHGISNKVAARVWAEEKSRELQRIKQDIEYSGRLVNGGVTLDELVAQYGEYVAGERGKVSASQEVEQWLRYWMMWCDIHPHLRTTSDLTPAFLHQYRSWLFKQPATRNARGKLKRQLDRPLSSATCNRHLSTVKAMLNWARRSGYVRLSSDDISDRLKKKPQEVQPSGRYLQLEELKQLIAGVVAHDTKRCTITREKHDAGKSFRGELPPKYEPLASLVFLLLLTGMRKGEALHLRWRDIDFTQKVILVRGDENTGWRTKTRKERHIPLEDSPLLQRMLMLLHENSDRGDYVVRGLHSDKPKNVRGESWARMVKFTGVDHLLAKHFRSNAVSYIGCAPIQQSIHTLEARFGHSGDVQRVHYLRHLRNVSGSSVEEWMGINAELSDAIELLFGSGESQATDRLVSTCEAQ